MDQGESKASWYKDNEFWKFHCVKGYTTLRCMKLKDNVQDLIDQKEITVGAQTSPNSGLQIYQNVFPSHNKNKTKAPMKNNSLNNTNQSNNGQNKQGNKHNSSQDHTVTYLDYGNLIGYLSQEEPSINFINIQGPRNECVVTTWRTKLNIVKPSVPTPLKA